MFVTRVPLVCADRTCAADQDASATCEHSGGLRYAFESPMMIVHGPAEETPAVLEQAVSPSSSIRRAQLSRCSRGSV